MAARIVYVTAPSMDEARALARQAVASRIAACANILPQMESVYRWEGEVATDQEVVLLLKTTDERVAEVIAFIEGAHSYDVPCAIALPIDAGSAPYLAWIARSVGG